MKISTKIGSKVDITVDVKSEQRRRRLLAASEALGTHSGVISSDDPDFVWRRRRGVAAVKFFDVGQIVSGSSFLTPQISVTPPLPASAQVREIAAGDYAARDAIFRAAENPSETFRQIKKDAHTANYNLQLSGLTADDDPVFGYSLQ